MDTQKRLLDIISLKKKIEAFERKYSESLEPELNRCLFNAKDSIQEAINVLQ